MTVRQAPWTTWAWFAGTLALSASVLFLKLDATPIEVWDEARLAINAWEMSRTGLSWVTTYGGLPDHWNTKPPLVIWLMSLSIRLVGANEWGIRLPSAIAAFATTAIIFMFCAFRLKRPIAGFAAVLLLLAPGTYVKGIVRGFGNDYVQFHAARSGDYDATLTLLTTSYLLAAWMFLHAPSTRQRLWLCVTALCIALAFLTKTVQGLIFLPALLLYAAWERRLPQLIRSPSVVAAALAIAGTCAGYYGLREALDPGYVQSALFNDIVGRYVTEASPVGRLYYLQFLLVVALLVSALQHRWGRGDARQANAFLGIALLFYLIVISLSANKQSWYVVPALPLAAMIIAIALDDVIAWGMSRVPGGSTRKAVGAVLVTGSAMLGGIVIQQSDLFVSGRNVWMLADPRNLTNAYLRSQVLPGKLLVFQESYVPKGIPGDAYYLGPTRFYTEALRAAGHTIEVRPPGGAVSAEFDTALVCGAAMREAVARRFELGLLQRESGCWIYRLAKAASALPN